MAGLLGFSIHHQKDLARVLAAVGGMLVSAGGRGGLTAIDASDPDNRRLKISAARRLEHR